MLDAHMLVLCIRNLVSRSQVLYAKRKRRRKKERDREKVEKNVKYKKPREVERERGNSKCYVKCERDYTDCCAFFYSKA